MRIKYETCEVPGRCSINCDAVGGGGNDDDDDVVWDQGIV